MRWHIWTVGVSLAVSWVVWTTWPSEPVQPPMAVKPAAKSVVNTPGELSLPSNWPPPMPDIATAPQRVPLPQLETPLPAAQSLAQAREQGDPRMPPIHHDDDVSEKPTAAELADPAAYRKYEARQHLRMLAAFTQAATVETPKLRDDIQRGRAAGIAPEQIAKVEEKLRRIEEMRTELLKEHPELAR